MEQMTEACWEGYKQVGMKDKGGKMVPNCVPINENDIIIETPTPVEEQQLDENPAAVAGIQSWGRFVNKMISQGTLTPIQGAVVLVGVPIALYHYIDSGFGAEYVRKIQNFMRDYKEKKNINPEQLDALITDTSDVIKDMPKGKQQHAAKLIRKNKEAMESGDKNAMLSAQRDLKKYVNREIDRRNTEMDDLHRATSNRKATAGEKRVAPAGAKHAGFGRWADASGKTLGYTRDGKWVPAKQKITEIEEVDEYCNECLIEYIREHITTLDEAEYQGRKVPLGKPMRGDSKKFKVYVRDPKTGNVKKVNFGDKTMRIKKSNPARRKSFRARHNCANPGPRTKARYWSCRKW